MLGRSGGQGSEESGHHALLAAQVTSDEVREPVLERSYLAPVCLTPLALRARLEPFLLVHEASDALDQPGDLTVGATPLGRTGHPVGGISSLHRPRTPPRQRSVI